MTSYIEYKRLMHTVGGEIDRNVVRVRETRWNGSAPLLGSALLGVLAYTSVFFLRLINHPGILHSITF
jgi:hypothetical protein